MKEYKERWGIESKNTIEPGLENVTKALGKLGNPHLGLNIIHVAGTNGKGSTIAMMNEMLLTHGITTACFYSPCFVDIHDQIQINGENISSAHLDRLFEQAKKAGLSGMLTDFELLTVLAFMAFKESNSAIILIETGMGGRLDSTNVIIPLLSVIPSISLEHEQFLGTTLLEVANHKAGIIKEGKPVIVGPLTEEALYAVSEESKRKQSPMWIINEDFSLSKGTYKDSDGTVIQQLEIGLKGDHQLQNAALAIRAVLYVLKTLGKQPEIMRISKVLKSISLPGRFEKINEHLYLDGAHNPASIRVLVDTIKKEFPNEPIHFVVGLIKGKNAKKILMILEETGSTFTFVDFPDDRAMSSQELLEISKSKNKSKTKEPIKIIEKLISNDTITIVTGSLYLLANIRENAVRIFKNV
jgi:dihydrofolate synthase/folylpolyglutamate synthase